MNNLELIVSAQSGNGESLDKLVEQNSPLVWSMVKRFLGRGCDAEDLYQIGCIGLVKAVRKFDLSYNTAFSTYAVPLIAGEIKRFLRDDGMVKVSRSLRETGAKAYAVRESYVKKHMCEPTVAQIAEILCESAENVTLALDAVREPQSLYNKLGDDNETFLIDQIKSEHNEDKVVQSLSLKLAIGSLEPRERKIINLRYFFGKTQSQVAKILGISQVQVSRIEKKVLAKLEKQLETA